jgi:uncharacterized protein (TIGR03118 family)
MYARRLLTVGLAVATAVGITLPAAGVNAGIARGSFRETDLVSNIVGRAQQRDPKLVNPWGISAAPASPMWVSDNNAGVTTLYDGAGNAFPTPANGGPLVVKIPQPGGGDGGAPTGTVFNPSSDFKITKGGTTGKALFIFATEDGTIAAWKQDADITNAVLPVDNSRATDSAGDVGAVYKGLAIGSVGSANYLYAANFRFGTVDVFDGQFSPALPGSFMDPAIPTGFAPFGIQNIGGSQIFVTYAKQNAAKHDDVKGPGNGFVDVFSTNGVLLRRFASGGTLNSPWGLALAPPAFGNFHGDVLVGNFGDGRITAFTPAGTLRGQLKSETNTPIQIDGLWGLRFGNGSFGASSNTLYFAAGINDEQDGLFGSIVNVDN